MNELKQEDVMKALECWASGKPCQEECSILEHDEGASCLKLTKRSALALLREKDAEIEILKKRHRGIWINNHCSICGMTPIDEEIWRRMDMHPPKVEFYMLFCPCCGAMMKGETDE